MSESHSVPPRRSGAGQHRAPRTSRLRMAVTGAATLAVFGGSAAVAVLGGSHHAPVTRADMQEPPTVGTEVASLAPTATLPGGAEPSTGSSPSSTPMTGLSNIPAQGRTPLSHPGVTTTGPTAKAKAKAPAAPAPTTRIPGSSKLASSALALAQAAASQAAASQARALPAPTADAATTPHPPTAPVAPTAPAAPTTPPAATGSAVQQVLALINSSRAAQGLAPYTLLAGLNTSAAAHTQVMADGCGLSHQCPGEAALGDRETAAGVHWTAAGENIGDGSGVADSASAIATSAVGLTQMMLDEKPPDDGHRQNILSSSFTHIGISIHRDSSGTVWMTQDFSN